MQRSSLALLSILALGACAPKAPVSADASLDDGPAHPVVHMMATPTAEIPWKPLDPGQPNGVKLWVASGDPATGPSVVLMQFPEGTASPPHTHTATYTAIVLAGAPVHGVSATDNVTLDVGAYWVQPGGEPHYDACSGEAACVLALAFDGPRDFVIADAPLSGAATMSMVPSAKVAWAPVNPDVEGAPDIAFLHGDPAVGPFVSMMRFPEGYGSGMHTHDAVYTGGVITGSYQHNDELGAVDLGAGAVWWQDAASAHEDVCVGQGPCTTFQVVEGAMSYHPVAEP